MPTDVWMCEEGGVKSLSLASREEELQCCCEELEFACGLVWHGTKSIYYITTIYHLLVHIDGTNRRQSFAKVDQGDRCLGSRVLLHKGLAVLAGFQQIRVER